MGLQPLMATGFVAVTCLFIGLLNVGSDEPQPAAAAVMLAVFALTLWRPRYWLIWTVLFAAIIPLSYILAAPLNFRAVAPPENIWTTAIALLPAGVACAIAYGIRFMLSRL